MLMCFMWVEVSDAVNVASDGVDVSTSLGEISAG